MTISSDRTYWTSVAERLSRPVLTALSRRELKATMPVETAPEITDRSHFTYLESLGRLLTGIAPWLELGGDDSEEGRLRAEIATLAREAIDAATDPASPDFMNFEFEHQPIVDTAFLAQSIVRAPIELWDKLPEHVRDNLAACLVATRTRKPVASNWLMFAAMIEAALRVMAQRGPKPYFWDRMRVDYAIRQHEQWYKGDGIYGDGPDFHWDYYNSFVIQPMLLDVVRTVEPEGKYWGMTYETALHRSRRWAEVQERLISPEGTFPPLGRSLAYRFGALQSLAQIALLNELPEDVAPSQVRAAMTTVIRRMMEAPGTFDSNGWLTIGFCGHQPGIGEVYISTGSTYLCAAGLLPLGLAEANAFWSAPAQPWTSQKAWGGMNMGTDHAV